MKRRQATEDLAQALQSFEAFLDGDGCSCPATDAQKRYLQTWVEPGLTRVMNELENGS